MKRLLRLYPYAGLIIVIVFLAIHLVVINDYGFTWDFHFHFFGGGKLLGIEPAQLEPRNLPFVEPDPRRAWTLPYGPLMSIPPVVSYLFLHKTLGLLSADNAYHLPIILWGVAGIGILYAFMREAFSSRISILAALFLALTPRYFGDLHNNMKDIPSAVIFALNIWLLWRLVRYRRVTDLFWAVIAFAIAFSVKINSIFIPVIAVAWIFLLWIIRGPSRLSYFSSRRHSPDTQYSLLNSRFSKLDTRNSKPDIRRVSNSLLFTLYFLAAPIAAFLLWSVFWPNPIAQLEHAYRTFGIGTNNIEVILNGTWYCSGSTVPWYYPFWYLAITTPLPILILFIMGIFSVFKEIFNVQCSIFTKNYKLQIPNSSVNIYVLILLWMILPLSRYVIPSVGVIDGIRHFEEVVFPLAALAAIGLDRLYTAIKNRFVVYIIFLFTLSSLLFTLVSYHPYQITYFNELVGGTSGALGQYDLDYWGTSQKAAVLWVNTHAPQNAKIHIVMAAAVAGQYLRPDLLANLNQYGYNESDYVILLNRQSFFYRFFYAYEFLLRHRPIHTISVNGAPLTWIFDNKAENKTPRQTPWWHGEDPCIIKYW